MRAKASFFVCVQYVLHKQYRPCYGRVPATLALPITRRATRCWRPPMNTVSAAC